MQKEIADKEKADEGMASEWTFIYLFSLLLLAFPLHIVYGLK